MHHLYNCVLHAWCVKLDSQIHVHLFCQTESVYNEWNGCLSIKLEKMSNFMLRHSLPFVCRHFWLLCKKQTHIWESSLTLCKWFKLNQVVCSSVVQVMLAWFGSVHFSSVHLGSLKNHASPCTGSVSNTVCALNFYMACFLCFLFAACHNLFFIT